jgi:hypothetical protein
MEFSHTIMLYELTYSTHNNKSLCLPCAFSEADALIHCMAAHNHSFQNQV